MVSILYMEDDPGIAHLVQDKLSLEGYGVTICENGEKGLETLNNAFFDMILLDFNMPGMSGIDVLKQLLCRDISTPVIMLTGVGNEMVAVEAMRNKAVDYIVKDVNLHFLELLPLVIVQALQEEALKLSHQVSEMALSLERERSAMIKTFITKATHEFRTPLSIIKTALYFLKHQSNGDDKILTQIKKIDAQSNLINDLVNNLVIMTQLDAQQSITTESVNLTNLLTQIIASLQSTTDIDILLETDEVFFVDADSKKLQLALTHVIDNAIRFNRSSGHVNINIRAEQIDNNILIIVEDNGIGITEENIPRIFERFYRVDSSHNTPGFGLGMSICQRIMELHKGDIYIESELDKGTSVTLVLFAPVDHN